MDANAISPTESVLNELRLMIVALGMRWGGVDRTNSFY